MEMPANLLRGCRLTAISLFLISPSLCAQQVTSEQVVFDSRNWSELYSAYRQFGRKSDGVVAGAFTDKVSFLLADDWARLSDLRSIAGKDKEFMRFVTINLNEAVPADRATRIRENATNNCTSERDKQICRRLVRALDRALKKPG